MSIYLTRYHDAGHFLDRAQDFLITHEAEHCLPLGIGTNARLYPERFHNPSFSVLEDEGGNIIGTALRTPPHGLVLSLMDEPHQAEAITLIVEEMAAYHGDLPNVGGPTHLSRAFAEAWSARTGCTSTRNQAQRIYRLDAVKPPALVPGQMRQATAADRDLMIAWLQAFSEEAFPNQTHQIETTERNIDGMLAMPEVRAYFLWEVEGEAVCMVGSTGPTPNGIRIGPVYTPPDQRKRGYGSALTAAVSQHHLDRGRKHCFLFTDLANPTSNKIYMEIGYVPVVDYDQYVFTAQTQ
ncbi:MAG: GNAT family N-acetyltransferase [bacterium]|nr:GNAT family N-acetyltransferase [bacterium]